MFLVTWIINIILSVIKKMTKISTNGRTHRKIEPRCEKHVHSLTIWNPSRSQTMLLLKYLVSTRSSSCITTRWQQHDYAPKQASKGSTNHSLWTICIPRLYNQVRWTTHYGKNWSQVSLHLMCAFIKKRTIRIAYQFNSMLYTVTIDNSVIQSCNSYTISIRYKKLELYFAMS